MSPIYYDWYMVDDGGYTTPTASTPANYEIPWIKVEAISPTSVVITLGVPTTVPGSYYGAATIGATVNDIDWSFTSTTPTYTKSGLAPGERYTIRVRAHASAGASGSFGEYIYESFTMPKAANVGTFSSSTSSTTTPKTSTLMPDGLTLSELAKLHAAEAAAEAAGAAATGLTSAADSQENAQTNSSPGSGSSYAVSGNREVQRSIFKITNKYKDREKYSLVEKDTAISTGYKKYAFGGGIFFDSVTINPLSGGGMGFFTSNGGQNGYFVEIQTDSSNKDTKDKSIKVFKVIGGKRIPLPDSQDGDSGRMYGGVIHSTQYKLDINVSITTVATVIDVYVNNFKISAVDTAVPSSTNPRENLISPTSKISLFSTLNATNFDYIYAVPLEDTQDNNGITRSLYSGQYANSTLNFLYGEKVVQNFSTPTNKNGYLEEFGTVARELRKVKVNFAVPAGLPLYASTGVNKYTSILGSRFSNHGAEVYVLNNAGTFIPLQAEAHNFFIEGVYVSENGQHEYTETTTNEYTVLEPAVFQSTWIQSESDAKSLFSWIKNQWSKQQQSINLEIFGNPAIEVGDVITINYPENALDGTQKFLITNVNTNFEEGLGTSITARSIYS